MKAAAEWFRSTVFTDEDIRPRPVRKPERIPAMLRTARSLENGTWQQWQSRESVFMKQARLLVNYEDDYDYRGSVKCYYPTYQSLSDQELRGYFTWRTKLRRGEVCQTSRSFAFLYIYELINQIGVEDPMDGYRKLESFRDVYGQIDDGILPYLKQWLVDYVIYYGLDPELLSGSSQVTRDRSIAVLEHIQEQDAAAVIEAVNQLAPNCLDHSRFYADYREDMDAVIARVLRRMSAHYAARCKKTMVEQYFGGCGRYQAHPFNSAVFCDPLKIRNYEYIVDGQCICRCENGVWSVWKRVGPAGSDKKLKDVLKTIDSVMRQAFDYRHPIKAKLDTKWILQIIEEETQALLAEKKAAEEKKITINYAQLTRIRQDAAITREKLIVEEEMDEPPVPQACEPVQPAPPEEPDSPENTPLNREEYRLLQCLLYGEDTGWVQAEGYMLSVLVDGINEKLYDTFLDSVLDDTPQLIEDYIDDLKEMVHP
ncbi:MAG: hypothetical protein HDT15_13255 [Oscillibacter sp.]|nr:hypothetical protein [Oscillibacter sp.]